MAFKRIYAEPKVVVEMYMDLLQGLANFDANAQAQLEHRLREGGIDLTKEVNHYIDWLRNKVVYWQ